MPNLSRIASRLREQMHGFLGKLRLQKPARRFVLEAVYGIQTRQSVHLTEIARALAEPIPLIKTVNRLSRQAARKGLAEDLTRFVIEQGAPRIKERTLLVIDPSDLTKKYARKMEHLARVRDGSEGKLADGYWLCDVVDVECGGLQALRLAQLPNDLLRTVPLSLASTPLLVPPRVRVSPGLSSSQIQGRAACGRPSLRTLFASPDCTGSASMKTMLPDLSVARCLTA